MPHDSTPDGPQDLGNPLVSAGTSGGNLRGFDEEWQGIVDYIVGITHRIWEERDPGLIERYYHPEVVIHTTDGTTRGREAVTAGSLATMNAFPDLRLYPDEVIWSEDDNGFHTSHRIVWIGHHGGDGLYGPPSGRRVSRRGIAHCLVRDNRIIEEWICRDELALLMQLGLDPLGLARHALPAREPPERLERGEIDRRVAQLDHEIADEDAPSSDPERFVRRALHLLFNRRLLGRARELFAEAFVAHLPPDRTVHGFGDYRAHLLGLLAAFPDLALTIDHQCHLGSDARALRPVRVATRWRLHGTHLGKGCFSEPSGRPITLLGISHHELLGDRIVREDSSYDLFALLKQLRGPERSTGGSDHADL